MEREIKIKLVLYSSMTVGVLFFGYLGIYVEVAIIQGLEKANMWFLTFEIRYPEGMNSNSDYKPWGNLIGLFVGIFFGWWLAKYKLAKLVGL
jgi:hypothetical protein